jgi:ribosomal protein S27E
LLKNIFFGGTKKPLRRIQDIVNCGYLSTKMFFIEIKCNEAKNKQIIYEVKQVNTRNEIVAKVKYLMVFKSFNSFFIFIFRKCIKVLKRIDSFSKNFWSLNI